MCYNVRKDGLGHQNFIHASRKVNGTRIVRLLCSTKTACHLSRRRPAFTNMYIIEGFLTRKSPIVAFAGRPLCTHMIDVCVELRRSKPYGKPDLYLQKDICLRQRGCAKISSWLWNIISGCTARLAAGQPTLFALTFSHSQNGSYRT